jgi:hypothetical protein
MSKKGLVGLSVVGVAGIIGRSCLILVFKVGCSSMLEQLLSAPLSFGQSFSNGSLSSDFLSSGFLPCSWSKNILQTLTNHGISQNL